MKKKYSAFVILVFINLIFALRYLYKTTSFYLPIGLIYALLMIITLWYIWQKDRQCNRIWIWIITGFFLFVSLFLLNFIPQESVMVDRWSVIKGFWNTALNGTYPYQTHSHTGKIPGPFPGYFFLAFPFYLIGEIGFYSISGVLLILYFWYRQKAESGIIAILLLSVCVYWEVATRSTVLINSMLFILYFKWLFDIPQYSIQKVITTGFIGGLLLSTRGIYLLPCVCILPVLYRNKHFKINDFFLFLISAMSGFLITFAPLLCFDLSGWTQFNPFKIQFGTMAWWIMPLLLIVSFILGFYINDFLRFCFFTGMILFAAIALYLTGRIQSFGFINGLFIRSDISRFLFAYPFLLFAITQTKQETTLNFNLLRKSL